MIGRGGAVAATALAAIAAGYFAGARCGRSDRDGVAVAALRDSLAQLRRDSARIDTLRVLTRDTLVSVRTRTDTVLRTLRALDTVVHVDTVERIVERERRACDDVVSACEAGRLNAEGRAANLGRQLALERRRHRAGLKLRPCIGAGLTGDAAGRLGVGGMVGGCVTWGR